MSDNSLSLPVGFSSADGKRLTFRAYLVLILLCIGFFTPGLASIPPVDRDESLFAQASKQMIESSNYVDIRIQNEHRYKKPIGIYWLQAASVRLLNAGHLNEIWAYRIPSTISAVVAVGMTAAIGSLLFGPMIGFLAALMMGGCFILNVEARQAKTDATLLASIMVAQYGLARAYLKQVSGWQVPLAFWTALGVGILIKGPIILLVVGGTLLWLRLSEKNLSWSRSLRPGFGIPYALLLTMPWLVAIGIASHGQFFKQSAGHDMLGKIANGEFRGMIPPGVHFLAFIGVFFPFSLFALLAMPDAWALRHNRSVRFCLGWIIPAWIVFEISLTKLPHYVMPMYPAIAILAAKVFLDGFPALAERRWRWLPPLIISLWLAIGTGASLILVLGPYLATHHFNIWQLAAGMFFIAMQSFVLFLVFQRKASSVIYLALGIMLFSASAFGVTIPSLPHIWLSKQVVQIADDANSCSSQLEIVSATYNEPSMIFLGGTNTQFVPTGDQAALELWLNPCRIAVIDEEHLPSFMAAFPNKKYQPTLVGQVAGYNAGRGRPISMTLYKLPPIQKLSRITR